MRSVAMAEGTGRARMSEGRRRAEKVAQPSQLPYRLGLLAGAVAAGVAWFFLVRAAIDFGQLARAGDSQAWAFTGAATVGATVCLLLMFVLVARTLVSVGLTSDYTPRRSSGRRASR